MPVIWPKKADNAKLSAKAPVDLGIAEMQSAELTTEYQIKNSE